MKAKLPKILYLKLLVIAFTMVFASFNTHAAIDTWQKSVTLRLNNQDDAYILASLQEAKSANANWISITPGWLTDTKTSSNVESKPGTPSDAKLIYAIQQAHNMGLKVMIKPHLDIKGEQWRGNLNPTDINSFFTNYSAMILKYAQISQAQNVEQLSIGAELVMISTNANYETRWRNLIASVRNVYSGKLTYSANADYGTYNETILPFWDALDVIGLSMYRTLSENENPTYSELLSGWTVIEDTIVQPLVSQYTKPVIFTEIGYRSVDFAAARPWDYANTGTVDLDLQKNLYQAMFEYWKDKEYFNGIHLWDWKVEPNAGGATNSDYTPQNKPAEEVLKSYFAGTGQEPGDTLIENPTLTSVYRVATASTGVYTYVDRSYVIQILPSYLNGKTLLMTRNADKYVTSSEYLQFDLTSNATVFVAFDSRATMLPAWLTGWTRSPDQIVTSDTRYNLFRKYFNTGIVKLGGNAALPMSGAQSNYFVLATTQQFDGATPTPTLTPTPTPTPTLTPTVTPTTTPTPSPTPSSTVTVTPTPTPSLSPTPIPTPPPSNIQREIVVDYPLNNSVISGEKKLKIYISGLSTDRYRAYYNVDNRGDVFMANSAANDYKQVKINFDTWTWNGKGPYNVVISAYDMQGNLIDIANLTLFIK